MGVACGLTPDQRVQWLEHMVAPFEHPKHDLNDVISAARGAAPRNESDRKLTLGRADSGLPLGPSGGGVGARRDPPTTNCPAFISSDSSLCTF